MTLRSLISRAVKPRLHASFGKILIEIPEFDDDELVDTSHTSELINQAIGGLGLVLEYENSKGERSQRVVTCKQFSIATDKRYLKAYCHHRHALRTFRLDRVVDLFDPKTGESLGPVQVFFEKFSPDKVTKSRVTWGLSDGRRADLIALLNALIFIARCDQEYHPAERACLERALTQFWLRLEVLGDPDFDDVLGYSDRLFPDGEIFWLAMGRFRQDRDLALVFKRQVQMLIEADGFVRQEEVYWGLEIDEFLSRV